MHDVGSVLVFSNARELGEMLTFDTIQETALGTRIMDFNTLIPSISPSPASCPSADNPGCVPSIPPELPARTTQTMDALSSQILSTGERVNDEVLKNWFDTLRAIVGGVIRRMCISIQQARRLFEESQRTHYQNCKNLELALEKVTGFWLAFSKENGLTAEYLRRQKFLCNGLMPIAGYMCTPRKVPRKYNRSTKNIRKNTQAIAHEATRI